MEENRFRRRFTREFKFEVIELVKALSGKVTEIAENLVIQPVMLHRLIREYSYDPAETQEGELGSQRVE